MDNVTHSFGRIKIHLMPNINDYPKSHYLVYTPHVYLSQNTLESLFNFLAESFCNISCDAQNVVTHVSLNI